MTGEATVDAATDVAAEAAALPITLAAADVIAEAAMLFIAVGGAVERGGKSWTMDMRVKDGTSGQLRVRVSMAESKYEPNDQLHPCGHL